MEPDWDYSLDLPVNLFADAFPVALAAIVLASSAAGSAASQFAEAVVAPEVELAYPAARQHSVALQELPLLHPDSPPEAAAPVLRPLQERALP